jgi:hypothetical protein
MGLRKPAILPRMLCPSRQRQLIGSKATTFVLLSNSAFLISRHPPPTGKSTQEKMQLGSDIAQSCPDLVPAIRHSPGVLAVCKSSAGNVGIFHLCNASAFCSLGEFLALLDNLNPISTRDFVPCILKCGSGCFEHCRMTSWNIVFFLKRFLRVLLLHCASVHTGHGRDCRQG